MKREKASSNFINNNNVDRETFEQNRKTYRLKKDLGLLVNYCDNRSNTSSRFSKYYETEMQYEKDKALANIFICEDKEIPEELYNKLLYTKKELEGQV